MLRVIPLTLAALLFAPALSAEGTKLPSFEECRGAFYAVTKYEHFNWAGHYRRIKGNTDALKEGERLAFQSIRNDFSDAQFEKVISIPELRYLSLVDTGITNEGLKPAERTTELLSINLWSCDELTNDAAARFKNNANLYSVSFASSRKLDDGWMSVLKRWPELTEICVDSTSVTGAGFKHFEHTPRLRIVEGWNTFQITDTAMEHLSRVTTLRSLNLWECRNTTSEGLQKLTSCEGLEELTLVEVSGVDDAFAKSLSSLQSLRWLELSYANKLSDKGVASLAQLASLKQLDLNNCEQLTDTSAEHISGVETLTALVLDDCVSLTDKAIEHVSKLENLTKLHLRNCPGLTKECLNDILKLNNLKVLVPPDAFGKLELEAVRESLPDIKIQRF